MEYPKTLKFVACSCGIHGSLFYRRIIFDRKKDTVEIWDWREVPVKIFCIYDLQDALIIALVENMDMWDLMLLHALKVYNEEVGNFEEIWPKTALGLSPADRLQRFLLSFADEHAFWARLLVFFTVPLVKDLTKKSKEKNGFKESSEYLH